MIRYSLRCADDHRFEGWFRSSDEFERQAACNLIACPQCGITAISRAPMAPAITGTRRQQPDEAGAPVAHMPPRDLAMMQAMRAYRKFVEAHTEDVGKAFPEEARRIHHGEAEERGIRGIATAAEADALKDEGIDIAPIPALPTEDA